MIRTFGAVTGITNQPKGLDTGAGINTSDATVTAADILNAKVAYGAGGARLVGTAVAGKQVARTTINSTPAGVSFAFVNDAGTTVTSMPSIQYSGYNFTPGLIFIKSLNWEIVWRSGGINGSTVCIQTDTSTAHNTGRWWRDGGALSVGNTSFVLPYTAVNESVEVWIIEL